MKPVSPSAVAAPSLSTLPLGARVWSVPDGRVGRVVTRVQGGITYRVELEGRPVPCERCGGDLLPLAPAEG